MEKTKRQSILRLQTLIRVRKRDPVQISCPIMWDPEETAEPPVFVPRKVTVPEHHIRRVYCMFDRLEEGCFTAKDVRRVFQTNSRVKVFTDRFDRDGDGEVTYDEFRVTMIDFVREEGDLSFMERAYLTMSEPSSCKTGFYFSVFVMTIIVGSTVSFVVESLPVLRVQSDDFTCCSDYDDASLSCQCEPEPRKVFVQVEFVCILLFTIEFLARVLTCLFRRFGDDLELKLNVAAVNVHEEQHRRTWYINLFEFMGNLMNLIDLAAILPFYFSLLMGNEGAGLGFLRVLRLARVFRIFKMGKYSKNVQLVFKVLVISAPALQLLLFFVVLGMVLFGSMLFFAEQGEWTITPEYPNGEWLRDDVTGKSKEISPYDSIPSCFWWVIVTMTTVGYGDTYPTSKAGKLIGSLAMLCGVLVLALPITIIGANFANEYARAREEEARERAEEEMRDIQRAKKEAEAALQQRSDIQRAHRRGKSNNASSAVHPFEAGEDGPSTELVGLAEDSELDILIGRYNQSKVKAMQMSTNLMRILRNLISDGRLSTEPAEQLIRELEFGQTRMRAGKALSSEFLGRQVSLVMLWIERAECEAVIRMPKRHGNELRSEFLTLFATMCGPVAFGSPDASSRVESRSMGSPGTSRGQAVREQLVQLNQEYSSVSSMRGAEMKRETIEEQEEEQDRLPPRAAAASKATTPDTAAQASNAHVFGDSTTVVSGPYNVEAPLQPSSGGFVGEGVRDGDEAGPMGKPLSIPETPTPPITSPVVFFR